MQAARGLDEHIKANSLVVVIPGIGGSVLREPGANGRGVWTGSYPNVARVLSDPSRIHDPGKELQPAGVVRTRMRFFGYSPIRGYHDLIKALADEFETQPDFGDYARCRDFGQHAHEVSCIDPAARVVAFPYDFRLDCEHNADQLAEFVQVRLSALGLGRDKSVIIVAHSMGGIVARAWLARTGSWPLCRQLLTLGTPHNGSPKALEMLVNGAPWWTVSRLPAIREMLRSWPAMYDLLPMYESIMNEGDPEPGSAVEKFTHVEFFDQRQLADPAAAAKARQAFSRYNFITDRWLANSTEVGSRHFAGVGRRTYQYATWDGHALRSKKSRCTWLTRDGIRDRGDGTVPQLSAIPMELQRNATTAAGEDWVEVKHSSLPDDASMIGRVIDSLRNLSPDEGLAGAYHRRRVRGEVLEIDLDVEDAYVFDEDEPATIGLEFRDRQTDLSRPPEYRIYRAGDPSDGQPIDSGAFQPVTNARWTARLSPLPPGEYRLEAGRDPYDTDPKYASWTEFDVFDPSFAQPAVMQ